MVCLSEPHAKAKGRMYEAQHLSLNQCWVLRKLYSISVRYSKKKEVPKAPEMQETAAKLSQTYQPRPEGSAGS